MMRYSAFGIVLATGLAAFGHSIPVASWATLVKRPASFTRVGGVSDGYVQNLGQWDAEAQFLARAPGVNLWITDTGVMYDFYRVDGPVPPRLQIHDGPAITESRLEHQRSIRGHVVGMVPSVPCVVASVIPLRNIVATVW